MSKFNILFLFLLILSSCSKNANQQVVDYLEGNWTITSLTAGEFALEVEDQSTLQLHRC